MKLSRLLAAAFVVLAGLTVTWGQTFTLNKVTWSWTAPTQYTDGTPIAAGTVITYKVFTSPAMPVPTVTPTWTGTTLNAVTSGYADGSTVYGEVEACVAGSTAGTLNCSVPTVAVSKFFPFPAPDAPGAFSVK